MNLVSVMLLSLFSLLRGNCEADLMFVGDAMQHSGQYNAAHRGGDTYDYSQYFTHIESDIRWADLSLVNLECSLGGAPYSGYPCFSAPDSYAIQLQKSGFNFFLTANNHCLDRRDKGARRTIAVLDSLGVPHIGTYVNAAARKRELPCIKTINGIRFGFLCYTYGTNGIPVKEDVVVDYIDRNQIAADIKAARDKGAQVMCVAMHWGEEYHLEPVASQKDLADFLVEQGVDLIIGGHPHVVEPMEMRHSKTYNKDVLLIYSLGNFVSDMKDIDCRGGAMVKVSVSMNGDKPVIIDPRYKLFFVQKPAGGGSTHTLIPEDHPELLRADSREPFNRFMQRTHDLVTSHNIGVRCECKH